ncbi:hypothetical protein [Pseudonocardia sp. NPDC049154]|uniref:hypothetical protein n=1 Tax=Pseudonocardia sp. NPDC049154 TaxID=3155501 RepID=UPI0033C0F2E5
MRLLLKRDLTIPELMEAATFVYEARMDPYVDLKVSERILRELRDRMGLSFAEIAALTRLPLGLVVSVTRKADRA